MWETWYKTSMNGPQRLRKPTSPLIVVQVVLPPAFASQWLPPSTTTYVQNARESTGTYVGNARSSTVGLMRRFDSQVGHCFPSARLGQDHPFGTQTRANVAFWGPMPSGRHISKGSVKGSDIQNKVSTVASGAKRADSIWTRCAQNRTHRLVWHVEVFVPYWTIQGFFETREMHEPKSKNGRTMILKYC